MRKKVKNANGQGSTSRMADGRLKWQKMIDGQYMQVTAKTPQELQEKIKKLSGTPIKGKVKVNDWFESWLENVKALKKEATYQQYNHMWKDYIEPVIGKCIMKNVESNQVQKVIANMNANDLSTWTMKHARKVMHICFEKALEDKIIAANPVTKIEIPNKQPKGIKTINTKELGIMFSHLKNTRWYWACRFLLETGLRRGEFLALKWSDIDYYNSRIIIDESNSSSGLGDTKSASTHYVPFSERAKFYLQEHKNMLISEFNPIIHNEKLKEIDLIFPSDTGTLMKPDSFNSVLDRINKKANIHITPHMFRHTFVYMSKGKLTLSELQEAIGHDESTTTLDMYGTMLSDTKKVANKIDESFAMLDYEIEKIQETKKQGKIIQFKKAK
jgi:integrase